jgi:hypothetical protein
VWINAMIASASRQPLTNAMAHKITGDSMADPHVETYTTGLVSRWWRRLQTWFSLT